ncbi:uncharacterized protein LOC130903847 isoform X2 [Diorhabda carinulata]|uniref:uncharacterized protein LOC130903847 isoform X2 n=1 Tax=Diorhabda carinulata TaxID=1163345 RepID=UPI0025A20532|nr:uncharacterized protein LOC130903847 isoform X2 [Diorhabda carinulata]
MEIKSEDAVLLFQKRSTKIFSSFSKSKFIEIEQEFQQLNDTLVQVKAEIEDPKDPDGLGFNINIKTENVEPISNNYNVCKRQAQLFRHQHYVQNICPVCRKRFSSFGKRKKHFMTHFFL